MMKNASSRLSSDRVARFAEPSDDAEGFNLQTIVDLLDRHVRAKPDERRSRPRTEPSLSP